MLHVQWRLGKTQSRLSFPVIVCLIADARLLTLSPAMPPLGPLIYRHARTYRRLPPASVHRALTESVPPLSTLSAPWWAFVFFLYYPTPSLRLSFFFVLWSGGLSSEGSGLSSSVSICTTTRFDDANLPAQRSFPLLASLLPPFCLYTCPRNGYTSPPCNVCAHLAHYSVLSFNR